MRWLCFLLASSTQSAGPGGGGRAAKPLTFDLGALVATRDSFVFFVNGEERGAAVWQYDVLGGGRQLVFTAVSELRPVETESLRVVMDRFTGAPIASYHRIDVIDPRADTVLFEHDLDVHRGAVAGRRRIGRKGGEVAVRAVNVALPPGAVWSDCGLLAAAVTNAAPGDSLAARAYSEFGDSLATLSVVAEQPVTVDVPAGRFETLALRTLGLRVFVTRAPPRRVVRGESLDGTFRFELAKTGGP